VTTTLPQSIFAQGFQDQVPQNPGVAENVMADYHRAVEKCKAKVDKISKECRLSNQKYNDPSFNLWNFGYCLRPLSTYVPREKGAGGDDSEEPSAGPAPPRLTLYVDEQPPINLSQLIAPQGEDAEDDGEESPGSVPQSVKRVRQIFDKPEFFVDGATADDVSQGAAGDCWFLSALSSLSSMQAEELGNLVERICVHRDEAVGVYGFVFYRDGEWRSEIIDDKLYLKMPDYKHMDNSSDMNYLLKYIKEKDRAEQYRKIVQSNSDALFYAKSAHKSETWVPLIEKAYAKAHGDYTAIEYGLIS
jgi:Calpain family cysteine protease